MLSLLLFLIGAASAALVASGETGGYTQLFVIVTAVAWSVLAGSAWVRHAQRRTRRRP